MPFRCLMGAVSIGALLSAFPASAQEAPQDDQDRVLSEVQVTSTRLRGTAVSDIEPEQTLTTADIEAYGVSSIEELIAELGPELASSRGRGGGDHVFLVDGVRIASFREIRSYPPEAIERMDVLPEEAALQYGYGANQRVINIVLKPDFSAWTFSLEFGGPVEGAGQRGEFDVDYLGIADGQRSSVDGEIEIDNAILESDRGLGDPLAGANSLRDESQSLEIGGSTHRGIFGNVGMTLSGDIEISEGEELLGFSEQDFLLPAASPFSTTGADESFTRYIGVPGVLTQTSDSTDANINLTLTRDVGDWFVTSTTSLGHNTSTTETDRAPDVTGFQAALNALDPTVAPTADLSPFISLSEERTERTTDTFSTNLLANGDLWEITGGWVGAGLSVDLSHASRSSETDFNGTRTRSSLDRQIAKVQGSFDFPLIVSDMDIPGFESLVANATVNASNYSDFGTLFGFDGTLSWSPVEDIRILTSYTLEEGAPSMSQLGDTLSVTPNVEIFDFVQGEAVLATRISGGNDQLIADTRQVWKASVEWEPLDETDLDLRLTYTDSRIDDPIGAFPSVDAAVEAAFPNRFVRDANGDLLSVDLRPVNYVEETRRDIRWQLTFRDSFAEPETPQRGGRGEGRSPASGGNASGAPQTAPPSSSNGAERPAGGPPPAASGDTRPQSGGGTPPASGSGNARPGGGPPPSARGGGRPRGGMMGRRGPPAGGRLFVSLSHTINLEDQRVLADGFPVQDFLNGAASGLGGQPEHEVRLTSGVFYKGYGARLSANWQSATEVDTSSSVLKFSDQTSVNLRFFHSVTDQTFIGRNVEWLRGTRFSLEIDNLLDDVVTVTDNTGVIPLRYEGNRLDPVGTQVMFSVRRQF